MARSDTHRRDPKAGLTRDGIVTAALALVDSEGLAALTMRALGRALGADPMAVYHHVPSKDALLDGLVEAVWRELRLPPVRRRWQDEFRDVARAVRDVLRAHPNALPVLATRQNLSGPGFDAADRAIAVLRRAGLSPARSLDMMSVCFSFLVGHALAEVGTPAAGSVDVTPDELAAALEAQGAAGRYPNLVAAIRAKPDLDDMDVVWTAGVAALVAGVETMARRRAGSSRDHRERPGGPAS